MATLTRTWVVLMLLTAVSMWAGHGGGTLGPLGVGLVLAAATVKADRILTHYLDPVSFTHLTPPPRRLLEMSGWPPSS
ncbi:hypothetical protein GAY28_21650, partial [Azospirillum brasilense]|nr:hypothetical protein [Azospirillum brasilense]